MTAELRMSGSGFGSGGRQEGPSLTLCPAVSPADRADADQARRSSSQIELTDSYTAGGRRTPPKKKLSGAGGKLSTSR